jgi:hypothetical protein
MTAMPGQLDTPATGHCHRCGNLVRTTLRALVAADGTYRCSASGALHRVSAAAATTYAAMLAAARRGQLYR